MARELTLGNFLGHSTRSGQVGFLRGWKKREGAFVEVWLHKRAPIVALWQHNMPHLYEKKLEDGSSMRHVYGHSVNCLESEEVLSKQYKRDRDTGERIVPPVICPICLLQEYLVDLFNDGHIKFTEPLFKWVGDDSKETQVLTFGGMLNRYGNDKLAPELKAEMTRAGVRGSEAWRENTLAKCNYVFTVVDNANPDDGVQIATETTSLGDHVKDCIADEMKRNAPDTALGNPLQHPYCIRWEHHDKAKEFQKKYKAVAMPRIKLTPEIEELIGGTPPDIKHIVKPPNLKMLRADLEAHYIGSVEIDWECIFGPAERAGFSSGEDEGEAEEVAEEPAAAPKAVTAEPRKVAATPAAAAPARRRKVEVAPEPEPEPEPEPAAAVVTVPCDECGHPMPETAAKCEKCGAEYEVSEAAPAEPEPEPAPAKAAPGKGKKLPF